VRTGASAAVSVAGVGGLTCCVVVPADSAALMGAEAHISTPMTATAANLSNIRQRQARPATSFMRTARVGINSHFRSTARTGVWPNIMRYSAVGMLAASGWPSGTVIRA
jgi:hypothetical protein